MKYFIVLALLSVMMIVACKQPLSDQPLPKGFESFYLQFNKDSVYQMAHISFPLDGIPDNLGAHPDYDPDTFKWQKDNWVMHHSYDRTDTVFTRQFNVVTPDLIEEVFQTRDKSFAMIRRYARTGDAWRLIYYAGLNKVNHSNHSDTL